MARSGIRYEEVKDAAETLLSRGLSPTIQRVREVLGTGSNTTISEHLKRWQQHLAETPLAILPPAVPETVMIALETFWKTALQQAQAAFDEQRAAAETAIATAEQARDQAQAVASQANQEAVKARRQQEILQSTARDLTDRLLIEQERRTAAETAISVAEQQAQTAVATVAQIRAETEARVMQLETALNQRRADLEQQKIEAQQQIEAERQRNEAHESRWLHQIDRVRQESQAERQSFAEQRQDWKNREIALQKQQEILRQENLQLRTTLVAAEERQSACSREIEQLKIQIEQCRIQAQQSETRYWEALRTAETLRGELNAIREERDRLQQQLAARSD